MKQSSVPFVDLKGQYKTLKKKIDSAIFDVIENTRFIQGKEVHEFENEFATYIGAKHCIAVNSGTDALILGIKALGLSPGDEIIVPVNTFIATALGVIENNLKVVFVDIDSRDYGMSIDDLKMKITKKTKAILAVHLYGRPDRIDEMQKVIRDSGQHIHLIEDACQAHGAKYKGKTVGSFGTFSAYSFYPGKNLGAYGDGGAIVTNDDSLMEKYKMLREYGQKVKYIHESFGTNSRLDTIQAAILRVKLPHLDSWNAKRRDVAEFYTKSIKELKLPVHTPEDSVERESIFHVYAIEVENRDTVLEYMNSEGVQSLIHYPIPLHEQKAFAYLNHAPEDFPQAYTRSRKILSLPMFPELTKAQATRVIQVLQSFYER